MRRDGHCHSRYAPYGSEVNVCQSAGLQSRRHEKSAIFPHSRCDRRLLSQKSGHGDQRSGDLGTNMIGVFGRESQWDGPGFVGQ